MFEPKGTATQHNIHKNASLRQPNKRNKKKKNIALPSTVQKIVDVVVKPFKNIAKKSANDNKLDIPFAESTSTELTTSLKFFYSNDRFIDTFDDKTLYQYICNEYPGLKESDQNIQHKRNSIIDMLNNDEYMKDLMENYGMTVFDIISFLFRLCPSIFKGIFIKKMQNILNNKPYVKSIKKHKYKIAKTKKQAFKRRRY